MTAYWQMVQYQNHLESHDPNAERVLDRIEAVLESMKRHSWYLEETLIPLALVNQNLPDTEKALIAKKLLSKPVSKVYHHAATNDDFCNLDFNQSKPPSLSLLVGVNSWFIFNLLFSKH